MGNDKNQHIFNVFKGKVYSFLLFCVFFLSLHGVGIKASLEDNCIGPSLGTGCPLVRALTPIGLIQLGLTEICECECFFVSPILVRPL